VGRPSLPGDARRSPSLWGPACFFLPEEEPELLAELERIARGRGLPAGPHGLEAACRAGDLLRFVPPSRLVERSLFTVEGDPLVLARAAWGVADPEAAFTALDDPPELLWVGPSEDDRGECFQLTGDRDELGASRPPLLPGAICFESSYSGLPGRVGLGTFVLEGSELRFDALSEARLARALALVEERLGEGAALLERDVRPLDLEAPRERSSPPLVGPLARRLLEEFLEGHYRRWLDEPLECLRGATPRAASSEPALRGELELLLRGIENNAERARRAGEASPDVGWLWDELGLAAWRACASGCPTPTSSARGGASCAGSASPPCSSGPTISCTDDGGGVDAETWSAGWARSSSRPRTQASGASSGGVSATSGSPRAPAGSRECAAAEWSRRGSSRRPATSRGNARTGRRPAYSLISVRGRQRSRRRRS